MPPSHRAFLLMVTFLPQASFRVDRPLHSQDGRRLEIGGHCQLQSTVADTILTANRGSFHEKLEQLGLPQWPVVKTAPSSAGQGFGSRGWGWGGGGEILRSHMPRGVAKKGKTLVHQAKDCEHPLSIYGL